MRNLTQQGHFYGPKDLTSTRPHCIKKETYIIYIILLKNEIFHTLQIRCVKLCKVVYYMNHTTGLCGSYSTQLYTTLHSFTQRFVHVKPRKPKTTNLTHTHTHTHTHTRTHAPPHPHTPIHTHTPGYRIQPSINRTP